MPNKMPALATLAALALPGAAFGHDFWIAPDRHRLEPGTPIGVGLEVGDDFNGERVPRRSDHLERFDAIGPDGDPIEVAGEWGDDPAGRFTPPTPGPWKLVYASQANRHQMTPPRFARYLGEEGLEQLVEPAMAAAAETSGPIRENYYRSVVALVDVGDAGSWPDGSEDRSAPVGLPLEIVAETAPRTRALAEPLSFRVLHRGEPLAGALVTARASALPALAPSARTDAAGRVELKLPAPGVWLVKAVHMERSTTPEADWISWWASLTFERYGR